MDAYLWVCWCMCMMMLITTLSAHKTRVMSYKARADTAISCPDCLHLTLQAHMSCISRLEVTNLSLPMSPCTWCHVPLGTCQLSQVTRAKPVVGGLSLMTPAIYLATCVCPTLSALAVPQLSRCLAFGAHPLAASRCTGEQLTAYCLGGSASKVCTR